MSRQPHGYAGRILTVDLSFRTISGLSTQDYATGFGEGRGIADGLLQKRLARD
jgi:aldehyde:ferredoxin oxidoreductase